MGSTRSPEAADDNWAKVGDRYVLADKLAAEVFAAARVTAYERVKDVLPVMIARTSHPFRGLEGANGYWDFAVPVLPADYVTDDAGTGFVHTAPGHGADDYNTLHQAQGRVRGLRYAAGSAYGRRRIRPTSPTSRSLPASASTTTRARMAAPTRR